MKTTVLTLMPRRESYLLALLLGACSLAAVGDASGVLTNLNTEQNLQQMMMKDVHAEAQKNVDRLFRSGHALAGNENGNTSKAVEQLTELSATGGEAKLAP